MEAFASLDRLPEAAQPRPRTAPPVAASHDVFVAPGDPDALSTSVVIGTQATLASATFTQWLLDRQEYVESQGWCLGPDLDAYDVNPQTRHILALAGAAETQVLGGLRLTRVRRARHSLSWGMMTPDMQIVASSAPEIMSTRNLYDLTRLIPSQRVSLSPSAQMDVLCQVFGAAVSEVLDKDEYNSRWIFTTTSTFFSIARRHGLFFNEIARSQHARVQDQIVFCSIRPAQAIHELLRRRMENPRFQRTAEHVMRPLAGVRFAEQ